MGSEQNEAVISGIAGKFPECSSVDELKEKLLSKSILLKPDELRKLRLHDGSGKLTVGRIPECNKFDLTFFGMPPMLVRNAEPMMGMMLEKTFEAILDAGMNPYSLKGHNIGVFAAPSVSDSEHVRFQSLHLEGVGLVGTNRAMMANRISYCFNFVGPSYSVEGSWVSSMQCLDTAVNMVSSGLIEAAVVTTASKMHISAVDQEYNSLSFLSDDGVCQPFDAEGHGFARGEAAVSFFIQRRRDAKRIYGSVKKAQTRLMGAKTCSYIQIDPQIDTFLRNFYNNVSERPEDVSYIEAHGICHKETDAQELNGLASVFCSHNSTPQLIGSITGNVGHADNCSGLVATVKAILAMETGIIPPTVNYHTPNPDVPALVSGKLKPVTENTELPGDLVAVNTLSCYGAFSHVLLKRHDKVKKSLAPADGLPRLVLLQARHEEGAKAICEKVSSMAPDVEFVSLVNDAFKTPIAAYLWRGYAVIQSLEEQPVTKFQELSSKPRPLWFIFSGMGSQWTGMGKELMRIPVFKSSIEKCDKVLRPKGIDIAHILTSDDASIFDNVLNSFIGITAIQIGLVDVLTALGITPDGMLGHSLGELGCAYADCCFTAEETILAAYARGKASVDSLDNDYIKGMMAAVGLGYNDIKDKLPSSIDVACHNSRDSCTISGPTDDVIDFVKKLKSDGVFARAVSAGGIAYHSRYIKAIAPKLLNSLKEIVSDPKPRSSKWISSSVPQSQWNTDAARLCSPEYHTNNLLNPVYFEECCKHLPGIVSDPKPRSSKWISSSVPQSQWNTDAARLCSPEYHTNNLLNPVYFEECCKHLPGNAILVEIAPHGLLQAILRRSVNTDSLNLSLTNRTVESNINHLLKCIGELHLNNVSIDVNALYPKVEYPVSRSTPSLAGLATWAHEDDQYTELESLITMTFKERSLVNESSVHPTAPQYLLWKDHRVAGQVVLPLSQILMYPWDMILASKGQKVEQHFTIIEDVKVRGNVSVDELESMLYSTFSPASLKFEVFYGLNNNMENSVYILSGNLVDCHDKSQPIAVPKPVEDQLTMEATPDSEVYLMLSKLGCELGPQFQLIKKLYVGKTESTARVKWNGNLVTFLDSMMKIVVILKSRENGILLHPTSFTKLTVDGPFLMALPLETELEVHYQSRCNRVVCQGAELLGLTLSPAKRTDPSPLAWSEMKFQQYFDDTITTEEFLSCSVQTAAEDGFRSWSDDLCTINILVLKTDDDSSSQYTHMLNSNFMSRSDIELKISQVDSEKALEQVSQAVRQSIIVVGEYSTLAGLVRHGGETGQLYCITHLGDNGSPKYDQTLRPISVRQTESGKLALLKRVTPQGKVQVYKIEASEWLNDLRSFVKGEQKDDHPIIVVTQNLTPRQVLPVLSKEPYARRIRTVFIQDRDAPQFSLSTSFYSSQLSLGLSVNILSGGVWGSLRTSSLNVSPCNFNLGNLITSSNENLAINCVGLNTTFFTFHSKPSIEEPEIKHVDYSGVLKGQRVMGVARFDPENNSLSPDSILTWPVPADWTTEDAVTVPVLYTVAYYCINLKAKVEQGEHVLVHAGMSPLGQAIITVALEAGAKVFASVMDEEEELLLTERFPNVKSTQVFVLDKEDVNVAVRRQTGGKGVEVIINCLRGSDFQSTIKVADTDCRILHLAEIRIEDREIIGLSNFFGNRSAFGISLNSIEKCSDDCKMNLRKALNDGINKGIIRPLKKRLFRLRELNDALRNLQTNNATEKTVLISKYENQVLPLDGYFQCNLDNLHIIAGENVELKFELAERLIHQGVRKLVLLNDEESKGKNYTKRINRIVHRTKCSTVVCSSSSLETAEGALQLLKEILHIGSVSSIFCVCMDENSNKMKNLDSASRQLLPRLQQFVSLLGSGSAVSDSRASSELPACSIQSDSSLATATKVLPYLSSLLTDTQATAKFLFVSDHFGTTKTQEEIGSLSYLPNSIEELYALGGVVESQPRFVEEVTRSPRYSVAKFCLLPVFVVPGLGRHAVKPLLKQLMHPAFCCRLPADGQSVKELADLLVQDVLEIQKRGPYNILGESWGGALALTIGQLLEAHGHRVNLILVQGIPTTGQNRLRALCRRYDVDLGTCILNVALNTQAKDGWSERLAQLLQTLEPDVQGRVSRAVTSLSKQLTSFLQFTPSKQLFKGEITLIRNKADLMPDLMNLSKFCQRPSKIVTVDENNHCQLVASVETATAINENMAYAWRT